MPHLILLGDSIFDNGPYTAGGPDVVLQVRDILPQGWEASLLAVDGAITDDIPAQIRRLPEDASHLVLSIGGNNALQQSGVLDIAARTTGQAVGFLADVASRFEEDYRFAVDACLEPGLPLAICTIYNGCFPDLQYQRVITTTLAIFNDVIVRTATDFGLPVIDLRLVCSKPADYANPIEPSSIGGAKIARALANMVTNPDNLTRAALVYGGG